jgi:carbon-monoxide dehydrogenase large subunit
MHGGTAVRWLEDCREHLTANANCREHHYRITGYADANGRLLALDCDASVDAGAYSVYPTSSALEAAQVTSLLPGPYDFTLYRCRSAAVATNKCPILPYRGVARTGVCLAVEAIMDAIAREAGIEPCEVRLRNLVSSRTDAVRERGEKTVRWGRLPGSHAARSVSHRAAGRARTTAQGRSGWTPDRRRLLDLLRAGRDGNRGLASWGRPVVPGYEQANVRLTADGDLEVRVGTHSHGQGHETTLAQVAHEILGVDFDRIKVLQGDTLYSPFSTGTWASRSIVMAGGAVAQASRALSQRISRIGAWLMQADPAQVRLENGSIVGGVASVTLGEVARAWYLQPQNLPANVDPGGLDVTTGYRPARDMGTFSYAAHAALVAVDPGTGLIEILDYVVVEDGGKLVNR